MIGLLGIITLLGIAVAMSNNRKQINFRIVGWGLGLQLIFALLFSSLVSWQSFTTWVLFSLS